MKNGKSGSSLTYGEIVPLSKHVAESLAISPQDDIIETQSVEDTEQLLTPLTSNTMDETNDDVKKEEEKVEGDMPAEEATPASTDAPAE